MWDRLRHVWLPRVCFAVALGLAVMLLVIVTVAPWVAAEEWPLLAPFAQYSGVRGAALASAVGLLVTACVFFRASGSRPDKRSPKEPPPGTMAGA